MRGAHGGQHDRRHILPRRAVAQVRSAVSKVEIASPCLFGARMDRSTKATLWIAFTILISYFVWFYVDCAMDDSCRIVCVSGGRRGCHTE
jgi:hypothetical protein